MSDYDHEREMGSRYAAELDHAALRLQSVLPIGQVRAIGRLEVVAAIDELIKIRDDLMAACEAFVNCYGRLDPEGAAKAFDAARTVVAKAKGGAA